MRVYAPLILRPNGLRLLLDVGFLGGRLSEDVELVLEDRLLNWKYVSLEPDVNMSGLTRSILEFVSAWDEAIPFDEIQWT